MKRLLVILSLTIPSLSFAQTAIDKEVVPNLTNGAQKAKTRQQAYAEKCPGVNVEPAEAGNLSACKAADDDDTARFKEVEAYVPYVQVPRKTIAQGSNVQVTGVADNTTTPPALLRDSPLGTETKKEEGHQ